MFKYFILKTSEFLRTNLRAETFLHQSESSTTSLLNGHHWRTAAVSNGGRHSNILVKDNFSMNGQKVSIKGQQKLSFERLNKKDRKKNRRFLKLRIKSLTSPSSSPKQAETKHESECNQQVSFYINFFKNHFGYSTSKVDIDSWT